MSVDPIDPVRLAVLTERVRRGLDGIEVRIREAGGDPAAITVVAVTKTFRAEAVLAALRNGVHDIGENFADELVAKAAALPPEGAAARWNFQGALQTNKINRLRGLVTRWQTLDSVAHADALAARVPGAVTLVQVNVTGGATRHGCAPVEVPSLVAHASALGLLVEGLMAIGPATDDVVESERAFASVRALADRLGLTTCSMGMSQDLEAAVRAGTTMVRIGSALFGERK